jgi:enoyl-CoA hydratase
MADVLTRIEGGMGRITLDRPRSLNALTLGMVEAVRAALDAWEADPAVAFVLIDGAGERGLCAGGDIRALYDAALAGIASVNEDFFRAEYQLNGRIARYAKPYVALMDGLVMGGGVGVSAHGSHRIVTERSRVAMPETGIGFFPDIGATWLLSRAPFQFGTHMGLTGESIGADDAIRAGLADVHVPSDRLPALVEALRDCSAARLDACLQAFSTPPAPGLFAEGRDWIAACYRGDDVQAIIAALAAHGHPAALRAAEVIKGRSPTSLMITLQTLRAAAGLDDLDSCLDREFRMAVVRTRQHDFIEGVRAAVVDKDRKPRWVPARLDEVGADDLAAFFAAADRQPPLWTS